MKSFRQFTWPVKFSDFSGLWYLHTQDVVHGDIKPANILVDEKLERVKLCDFGISRIKTRLMQTTTMSFIRGTLIYMAPESCIDQVKPNFQTDVWCAGSTILEILHQTELWNVPAKSELDQFLTKKMKKKEEPSSLAHLRRKDKDMYAKVKRAFHYDPKKRATAKELFDLF